jgi:cytochrome o ubiquinol oxidase subunit 2
MIYAMNGMTSQLNLAADREGEFYGRSAQFSGDGFSQMQFNTRAVSPEAFGEWTRTAAQAGASLDRETYAALAQPSSNVAPATYRLADSKLFDLIATRALPPSPGPTSGRPTIHISPRTGG